MKPSARRALSAGLATSIGSLPHVDPAAAVDLVRVVHPRLPALPELPRRNPAEGLVDRWLPGEGGADGLSLRDDAHGGFLAFLDAAVADPPSAVKAQVAGPLTLAMGWIEAGAAPSDALDRGTATATAAVEVVVGELQRRLPHTDRVVFLDEPALVSWTAGDAVLDREAAIDALSGVLSHIDAVTGVHVCGQGDRRMAIEAGPDIVGFEVATSVIDDAVAIARYLDAGGWVAWGAVPTDRPVGERADHWWNALVGLWCELTRGGCDPVTLRTQALITPACGLAMHSEAQAETILRLCVEIGARVGEQAVATRLSVGA